MNTEKLGDDASRWMGESQRSDNVSIEAELSISNETLGKCKTNFMHVQTEGSVVQFTQIWHYP